MERIKYYTIIFILFAGIGNCQAQQHILSQKFSFGFDQEPVESALDTISKTIGYSFSYNPSIIGNVKQVTANYNQVPLLQVLQDIFQDVNLSFKEVSSYIAITRKTPGKETTDLFSSYVDSSGYFYLKAKVVDISDKKPVPFANVLLKGSNLGTVSNLDGNFTLKIPSDYTNDTLVVSFIGYKTVFFNISAISNGQIIMIEPVSIELDEVIVNQYEPKTLIKLALGKVGENYSDNSQLQIGFYRETSRQNNDYIVISEAVLKILKAAYDQNYKTDQVTIFKSRKNPFVKTMDTVLYKLQGGIYNCLMIDMAKYPASFISEDYFDMYEYTFDGVTQYNNGLVYVISFDQKPEVNYSLYKGKIYIDKKSLAFVKAEFGISPRGLDYATSMLIKKTSSKVKAKVLGANYMVSYANMDDRWQLHHVREDIRIKVRKKFSFFNSNFHSVSELVITDADTATISRFRYSDLIKPNNIFAEISTYYDESYWGKFNFIQPEVTLEEAYGKIRDALSENGK